MKETFSEDFKKFFLMRFTEELIRHSEIRDLTKLQEIIESEEKRKREKPVFLHKELVPEIILKPRIKQIPVKIPVKPPVKPPVRTVKTKEIPRHSLLIPEPRLPEHLEYLKPIPTAGIEIDLFKLNPLIKDPAVRIIEVNPDEKVIVSGTMGTKLTGIILNKEDIDRVINKISEASKIPLSEGIYKVVVGNLILLAIISEVIGSRFLIRKMAYPLNRRQYSANPAQGNG